MSKVVVIGSVNQDIVIKVDKIPQVGETVLSTFSETFFGGKGSNQAIACGRLGRDCSFIGKIGGDSFGSLNIKNFLNNGVETEGVIIAEDEDTGLAIISVDKEGNNSIIVLQNANGSITYDEILKYEDIIDGCEFILIQLEIPIDVVEKIISLAYEKGKKIILNPAPAAMISDSVLSKVYCITPNESEIYQILGKKLPNKLDLNKENILKIFELGEEVIKKGVKNVVITIGSYGVIYINKDEKKHYLPFSVVAIDTTGAGDTFNGSLVYYLSEGYSFPEAILNSQGAAALSTLKLGAQTGMPYLNDVENFVKHYSFKGEC